MTRKESNKGRKFYKAHTLPKGSVSKSVVKGCLRTSASVRISPKMSSDVSFQIDPIYSKAITNIYNQEISDIDSFVKFTELITNQK